MIRWPPVWEAGPRWRGGMALVIAALTTPGLRIFDFFALAHPTAAAGVTAAVMSIARYSLTY